MKLHHVTTAFVLFIFFACNNPQQQPAATEQPAAPPAKPVPSKSEQMKTAYQEINKAFETGVTDNLSNYVAEDVNHHGDVPPSITSKGLQQLKDMIALYRKSFTDIKIGFHQVVVDGDILMGHGSWSGTNSGEFMGKPATNKPISNVEFIDVMRFENGKAVEHWEVVDNLAMFTQLGIVHPQGPDTKTSPDNPSFENWSATETSNSERISNMKAAYKTVIGMIEKGDLTGIENYVTADVKEHSVMPGVKLPPGLEGVKQNMAMFKQAYPDLKITIDHLAAEGDNLIAHVWVEGTFSGKLPGFPASAKGKKVKFADADIVKFNAEGKATDHWEVGDHYTEMVQLGVIPAPQGQASAQ